MVDAQSRASVLGLIVFGTIASLLGKIVYELSGKTQSGAEKLFRKPWASTAIMFLGMSLCLPLGWLLERFEAHRQAKKEAEGSSDAAAVALLKGENKGDDEHDSDEHDNGRQQSTGFKSELMLILPTMFDLTATALMSVGLLYVTASVYQMLRGAEMLFAAIFSVIFLKRTLNKYNIMGVVLCLVGIAAVGMSSVLSGQGAASATVTQKQILFGMALIVLSQGVQAAQITIEDHVLRDNDMQPLKVVGWEGIWGSLLVVCVLLPVVQHTPGEDGTGLHEDTWETIHMITHSKSLPYVVPALGLTLLAYNIAGMFVTDNIGAVARTVLETMRTLFVWLIDLLLYYTPLGLGRLGEAWDKYSYLQALGFAILVAGTVIYGHGDDATVTEHLDKLAPPERAALRWQAAAKRALARKRPIFRSTMPIGLLTHTSVQLKRLQMHARLHHDQGL